MEQENSRQTFRSLSSKMSKVFRLSRLQNVTESEMWLYEIPLIYENYFDNVQWDVSEPISNVRRFDKKEMEQHERGWEREAEKFNHS